MASARVELVKLCNSRDWSKAIHILDSLLAQSCSLQDICNRAFCYSQLELHKHVIKDCDKALQLESKLLQAYILKGYALSALGRKDAALLVWGQGYEQALNQSSDLKQLLELEELLRVAKQDESRTSQNHLTECRLSVVPATNSGPNHNGKSGEALKNMNKHAISSLLVSDSASYNDDKSGELEKNNDNHVIPQLCSDLKHLADKSCSNGDIVENGTADKLKGRSLMHELESGPTADREPNEFYKDFDESSEQSNSSFVSKDASEIFCKSSNKFENGSSYKGKENKKSDSQTNGARDVLDKQRQDYASSNSFSEKSDPSIKSPVISINSNIKPGSQSKLSIKVDINDGTSNEGKRNKKFRVARISKSNSISVDFRLSRGIAQVNEGNYSYAISIFDQILKEDPTYPEALMGRGTAYAFQQELEAAIADFTKAIQSNPSAGEAWKRRGQARAALGDSVEAIKDLTKALEFEPDSADILHERGIVNFKFKSFNAANEDLSACVRLEKDNKSAYTYLGLTLSSIGEYKKAEEAHSKSIQLDGNFLEAWGHLTQLYQELANHKRAFECIQQMLQIDKRFAKAYHLRGLLFHGMGAHRKAIGELSTELSIEGSSIECLYLRASCYHSIGEYAEAVKDYDATMEVDRDSVDKFVLQCLAFYQKEIALYTASKFNSEFCWFDIDGDIDPLFKEYWCKRLHPKNVCEKVYRQPPLRDSMRKGKLKKLQFSVTKQKTVLLLAADSIGKTIQYDCPGFLPNKRQHRMAGLAAIEIAQKVSKAWRSLHVEWRNTNKTTSKHGKRSRRRERISMQSQNRGGAGCSTSSISETSNPYGSIEDKSSTHPTMTWQDLYSLAVKWRQISEPCDPVVWVNKLSEEFNIGFGSRTPMVLGQAKAIRYFPNYERTLNVAKTIIKDKLSVHNKADEVIDLSEEGKLKDIMRAKTCADLYKVIGEDFWLATWCNSTAFEGKKLEGTRITCIKTGENGFDFAIRTPCTPSRWEDFDTEMTKSWEAICDAYCGEYHGSTNTEVIEKVRDAILRMTYYWYNFMPLSRGTAVVGFATLLGLFLAANMEFTGNIPKGLQVDWEAILNFDPNTFVESTTNWLHPSLKVTTSWKSYPDVSSTLPTTGSVVAALSTYHD